MNWLAKNALKRKINDLNPFVDETPKPGFFEKVSESTTSIIDSTPNPLKKSSNWWHVQKGLCQYIRRGDQYNCTIKVEKNSKYCLVHKCRRKDCGKSRIKITNGYCPEHQQYKC